MNLVSKRFVSFSDSDQLADMEPRHPYLGVVVEDENISFAHLFDTEFEAHNCIEFLNSKSYVVKSMKITYKFGD